MGNVSLQMCLWGSKKLQSIPIIQYGEKYRLPKKAENSFKMDYDPELDISPELDPDAVSYYLTVIDILR